MRLLRGGGVVALTGAGCSTASGIPDYRDEAGDWKRAPPVSFADFVRGEPVRRRYWARSAVGWHTIDGARPNDAHHALAALEGVGLLDHVITQNVDGLHQRAGHRSVLDLHGRLDRVTCLDCGAEFARAAFQSRLEALNPGWHVERAPAAPDGDADVLPERTAGFRVPDCAACQGTLKPSVVFFGETVPADRVAHAHARVEAARVLLVVGSSLMVYSGLRFVRAAARRGTPVVLLNRGRTRADDQAHLKIDAPCGPLLRQAAERLGAGRVRPHPPGVRRQFP